MLNRNKNQEESVSKEESVEENEFGPHYHTMYTNEPPMEIIPEELQEQENVGDNPPKDVYFQPIPISDKIGMAERNIEVGTGGGQQIRETVLLAVSSATLAVLLLLTVFCAAAVYYCSRPYNYLDDYSYTSSERRLLLCPSDSSSYTRTEDSSLVWSERTLTEQSSSEIKHTFVDEISTFSDESARTAERDKSESVPCDLEPGGLPAPSVPPPAEAVPPPAPEAPPTPAPPPAPEAPPAPAEGAPPPAQEAPPASAPAEGAPPGPPAEGVPPPEAPPPAV
ncbi:formin-1-like [Heteronotia binoei]|uniref:formin-1-like n=1 Tax=Heteronotia binoei TaxID=13085 RepID=UPI00292E163F|nr:formin-1-like [Heteronotia binoei]